MSARVYQKNLVVSIQTSAHCESVRGCCRKRGESQFTKPTSSLMRGHCFLCKSILACAFWRLSKKSLRALEVAHMYWTIFPEISMDEVEWFSQTMACFLEKFKEKACAGILFPFQVFHHFEYCYWGLTSLKPQYKYSVCWWLYLWWLQTWTVLCK